MLNGGWHLNWMRGKICCIDVLIGGISISMKIMVLIIGVIGIVNIKRGCLWENNLEYKSKFTIMLEIMSEIVDI